MRGAKPVSARGVRAAASSRTLPRDLGSQGPIVAYLGKLTPRKRVDVLVQAFAQLRVAMRRWSWPATTWAVAM